MNEGGGTDTIQPITGGNWGMEISELFNVRIRQREAAIKCQGFNQERHLGGGRVVDRMWCGPAEITSSPRVPSSIEDREPLNAERENSSSSNCPESPDLGTTFQRQP